MTVVSQERERIRELDSVHSLAEWRSMVGISEATHRRLKLQGKAPKEIELSTQRRGIRHRDHLAWLDARTIGADDAA